MKCFALDKFCIVRLLCFFVIKSRFVISLILYSCSIPGHDRCLMFLQRYQTDKMLYYVSYRRIIRGRNRLFVFYAVVEKIVVFEMLLFRSN